MPFVVSYDVDGAKQVEHRMLGMAARAIEPTPILAGFAEQLRSIEREEFETEGHGTWEALAPSTVAKRGSAHPILRVTDALFDSATDGATAEIHGAELIFGPEDPKAELHQQGTSRMPARPPVPKITSSHLRGFTGAIQAWIIAGDRAAFGVGSFGLGSLDPFGL